MTEFWNLLLHFLWHIWIKFSKSLTLSLDDIYRIFICMLDEKSIRSLGCSIREVYASMGCRCYKGYDLQDMSS